MDGRTAEEVELGRGREEVSLILALPLLHLLLHSAHHKDSSIMTGMALPD